MKKTSVVTARIDDETLMGLDRLGDYYERSRSWLVAKAVARYVKEESEFFAFIQEGEDAIDRGEYLTQEQMEAWVKTLGQTADAA